ncbi:MAG TPA: hypothetical protein VM490_21995 [Armatimonadaceae bacterium]|nr:hypothetical protein [Armatimonadaceae bacterium]
MQQSRDAGQEQYVILLDRGRESEPLSLTALYDAARRGVLKPNGMVFDLERRAWIPASEVPPLRAIFRQIDADRHAAARAADPLVPEMPAAPEPSPSLWQRLFGTHRGGAL